MTICCPSCTCPCQIDPEEYESYCQNPECHVPYRFKVSNTLEDAVRFYGSVASWKPKYIFEVSEDPEKFIVAYFNEQIQPYQVPSMSQLVGEETLRAIQAGYADYLGGPITLLEITQRMDGGLELRRIEPLQYGEASERPSHLRLFTRYCTDLRIAHTVTESGDAICMWFDEMKAREYISSPPYEARWHFCWCGLVDYIAPLIVNNKLVGLLFSGQRRMDNVGSEINLQDRVVAAAERLSLNPDYMLTLVHDQDVRVVDIPQIKLDLKQLQDVATRLVREAEHDYATERQVREGHFLEEIEGMLLAGRRTLPESMPDLWKAYEPVLQRVHEFLGLFTDTFLLLETAVDSKSFQVVASARRPRSDAILTIPKEQFDHLMPDRLGPFRVSQNERSPMATSLSVSFLPYEVRIGWVIRMLLKSGHHLLLVIAASDHFCDSDTVAASDCDLCSDYLRRFLAQLGTSLAKATDILLYIQHLTAEEKRKEAFLTHAAHDLSLPIESMLADSAGLQSEIAKSDRLYELAAHNFNEVQRLHLAVENILHGAGDETLQPSPQYEAKSILEPLKQASEMFAGEASDKGCDIRAVVIVGEKRVSLTPSQLDEASFYWEAFYLPMLQKRELPLNFEMMRAGLRPRVVLTSGREVETSLVGLPRKCHELILAARQGLSYPLSVVIDINDEQVMGLPSEAAALYLPPAEMVPRSLALALKNLVHNAVKYSYRTVSFGQPRYVEICCKLLDGRYYEVTITNYGIGILEHEIEGGLIWRPRYRGILSMDRNRSGSGLGLSHTWQAVTKVHGGRIEARSLPQSGGAFLTVFTVTLPIRQIDRLLEVGNHGH